MKVFAKLTWAFSLFILFAVDSVAKPSSAPLIVVTIKPIYSLVVGLMKGVGKPVLLFDGKQNPHSASLKPSQIKKIKRAKRVIWVGPNYETGLAQTLTKLVHADDRVELMRIDDLMLYRPREGKLWAGGCHHHHKHKSHKHTHRHDYDPHIWLDPRNAKAIVRHVAKELMALDPVNKEIYRENWYRLHKKIDKMTGVIVKKIKPARDVCYMLYHDSTQYFDRFFRTKAIGSVVVEPSIPVSAKHMERIFEAIRGMKFKYLFLEPLTSRKHIWALLKKPELKIGTVDPTGMFVETGEDSYFDIMHHLADNLSVVMNNCVS